MKQTLKLHGRTHGPYGSDPIAALSDALRFNVDNEGGYVQIVANDHLPASDSSIELTANLDGLGDGGDIEITAADNIGITAAAQVSISGAVAVVQGAGASLSLTALGALLSLLASGSTFVINDHLGSPLVTYTG